MLEDEALSNHTTFKIGGPAKFFVLVPSKEILLKLISALNFIEERYYIIGHGANIMAKDEGFDGVVVKLSFDEIVRNANFVYADAGAMLCDVIRFAMEKELSGLEWATGIPATVGGAIFMNAGAHGGQIADVCVAVDVLDNGEVKNMTAEKLKMTYRTSMFQKRRDLIILGGYFALSEGKTREQIKSDGEMFESRRVGTPALGPSAGSTFKKPREDFYVGKEVDELGLRGFCIGDACVSPKHGGIIINKGNATYKEVAKLIRHIKKAVYEKHGVRLQVEPETLG